LPTVGLPLARRGGQADAQAPKQALFVPESFWNRYRVWPCESTRTVPSPPTLAESTVADCPDELVDGGEAEAESPLLPPPQPRYSERGQRYRQGSGDQGGWFSPDHTRSFSLEYTWGKGARFLHIQRSVVGREMAL
jgi:hypothetical protein